MSDNKFIKRLKGEQTAKSVLEIKNESAKTSFANMPQGTSNAINVYSDHRGNATAVLEGTDIWKLNSSQFVAVSNASGDGRDFTSTYTVFGSSLWVNATYTFDEPKIFTGATQWTLKLCGHSLLSSLSNTIGFSLIIKFGNAVTITKSFLVSENAFEFCKEFIIDFSESEQNAIKVINGNTMTVQLLCTDATASATIYNGMTTLVAQQRRVDGEAVASDLHTFEDLEVEIAEIQDDIESIQDDIETIQDDIADINGKIIVRSATIPTASADLVGKVYQYAGTTNGQYTHNYIYECVAGETTYDGLIGFEPTKIAFDYTKGNLAEFFSDTTPNFAQITHGTFTYLAAGDLWAISGQDANENVLFDNYKLYTQDLEDAGFVFINPPQDYTDGEVIDYTVTFTPQPTTYSWARVDVQPDRITQIQALQADVTDIQALIPAQASPTNQLGDKNFINSSIATNTANFIGTFNSVAELEAYSGTKTNNDYAFVIGTDSAGNTTYNRYKYNANTQQWIYEYTLNNSSFTANQWAAINSGVTTSDVSKARSAVQPSDVGNGTITITQGGVNKGTFTTNQSGDTTVELDAGAEDVYTKAETDALLDNKANADMDNLTSTGANIANWSSNVSNCITNIPQDIKLELNNGTLTLKAGSKVYVPNGAGVFDTITIASDLTLTQTWGTADQLAITVDATGTYLDRTGLNRCTSGTTAPTISNYRWWYDTSANLIKVYNRGAYAGRNISFPIAIVTVPGDNTATVTSIDQIFNGFGYIGSTVFALPGVKGLIPDGRNADGTLNNTGWTISDVITRTFVSSDNGVYVLGFDGGGYSRIATRFYQYDESENIQWNETNLWRATLLGYIKLTNGAINNLPVRTTFHAVDYNEADFIVSFQRPTAANNYTWYRKYKSGWVEQGGLQTSNTGSSGVTVTLPVAMADANYTVTATVTETDGYFVGCLNKTTTSFLWRSIDANTYGYDKSGSWQVSGMAAKLKRGH